MTGAKVFNDAVETTLTATFYPTENLLDVQNDTELTLIEWYGVEDVDDAIARIRNTFRNGIGEVLALNLKSEE